MSLGFFENTLDTCIYLTMSQKRLETSSFNNGRKVLFSLKRECEISYKDNNVNYFGGYGMVWLKELPT